MFLSARGTATGKRERGLTDEWSRRALCRDRARLIRGVRPINETLQDPFSEVMLLPLMDFLLVRFGSPKIQWRALRRLTESKSPIPTRSVERVLRGSFGFGGKGFDAAQLLVQRQGRQVVPLLLELVSPGRDYGSRQQAAYFLGTLQDPRAVAPLIEVLREPLLPEETKRGAFSG